MSKIFNFLKIKKGDKLIFYKVFVWIFLISIIFNCIISGTYTIISFIEESKKDKLVFEVIKIDQTTKSLEVDVHTNLPNNIEIALSAKPVKDLNKIGFSESGLGIYGIGKVNNGKAHIKFQGLGKSGKSFVICNTPYTINASIFLNNSNLNIKSIQSKYKESDKLQLNTDLNLVDISLGEFDMDKGLSLDDYKKYCKKEQSDQDIKFFNEYLNKYTFNDISKVSFDDPEHSSVGNSRIVVEGVIQDVKVEDIGVGNSLVNIFIKLTNGELIDLKQYQTDLKAIYGENKSIKKINTNDLKKGNFVKVYGYNLNKNGFAYLNGTYKPINKTVLNTSVNTYDTYDCPNMNIDYIDFTSNDKPLNQVESKNYESYEGESLYHRELYESAKSDLMSIYDIGVMNDFLNNNINIESIYEYHTQLRQIKDMSVSWADTLWQERNCNIKSDVSKEKEERLYISKIVSSLDPTVLLIDHYNDGQESITQDQVLEKLSTTMQTIDTNLNKIKSINFIN